MKILVTGATGFIGSHIVRLLCHEGHQVRVLKRGSSPTGLLDGLEIETLEGDITDPESVVRAMSGCEVVFHVAGLVSFWNGDRQKLWSVNVDGTRNVVAAALRHKIKRLIHTSSISAIGYAPDGTVGNETLEYNWRKIPYCDTKREGELEVLKGVEKGLDAVIVNPGVVFGPGDLHLHGGAMVLQMVRGRITRWFEGGCCTCDVKDVAEGHLLAWRKGRSGERYILGGKNLTWRQLFAEIATVVGRPAPARKISRRLLQSVAIAYALRGRLTHQRPPLTLEAVRVSTVPVFFSSDKAVRELGYKISPLEQSLQNTYSWYQSEGYYR